MSAGLESPAVVATDSPSSGILPRTLRGVPVDGGDGPRRIRVGIIGATGYVGAELIRLLDRHPNVAIVGLRAATASDEPIGGDPRPPRRDRADRRDATLPPADAVFLALPHGAAAAAGPGPRRRRAPRSSTSGPTSGCATPADYPRWYGFEHPRPDLLDAGRLRPARAAPRRARGARRRSRSPSSARPAATRRRRILALAPLARAGLIGDLVVDAKSGVSGAGREAKPDLMFGEVNESVKAYGIGGHRHVAEMEQELAATGCRGRPGPGANPGVAASTSCRTSSR